MELPLEALAEILPRHSTDGPRYTSYPTAPVWSEAFGPEAMATELATVDPEEPLAVYVHVPFCRSLCHFCACNRVITKNPSLPERYLTSIEGEIAAVAEALGGAARLGELHWGGGTPTHLDSAQIERLFSAIAARFVPQSDLEASIEVDPRVTTAEQIDVLAKLGFRRISMGIQDFAPRVQAAIHRIQSVEDTAELVERCRASGFASVGFDLIHGLPFQTTASFAETLDSVIGLRPDRIALYAYAHVTWVARQQRGFERHDLPGPEERLALMLLAIERLQAAGYEHVGMDHFALPHDALSEAAREGRLHRNFMGYTTRSTRTLIGLGPSAISELPGAYAQSRRDLPAWGERVDARELATLRGHHLSDDDLERRWIVSNIMCDGYVSGSAYRARFGAPLPCRHPDAWNRLSDFESDGLVERTTEGGFRVTPAGRLLVRNVAMLFDAYLPAQLAGENRVFSRTV